MPNQYQGLGGRSASSPYTYNIIRPSGVNEVGSQYTDLDIEDPISAFMGAYRAEKDRSKEQRRAKQEEAIKISEMLGYVPEELEGDILGPIQPDQTTLGEKALGGLGRLVGVDTEMGLPKEQFEIPEGKKLSTKYERDLEKTERETKADYTKFLRDLYKQQFGEELKLGTLRSKVKEGLVDEPLSFEQEKELIRERAAANRKNIAKNLSAREKLQNDLYTGAKNLQNLTEEDYLILGKYWSSSTPAARSKEALRIATDIFEADQKGRAKKATKEERKQFIDEIAREIVQTQDALMGEIRESDIEANRNRGGLYGLTGDGQPTLDDIWTGPNY